MVSRADDRRRVSRELRRAGRVAREPRTRWSTTCSLAKKRGGRRIPMASRPAACLGATGRTTEPIGPVIRSYRGSHLKANSIVNWFVALFKELGYEGCWSHSGRRSFITAAAGNIHCSGGARVGRRPAALRGGDRAEDAGPDPFLRDEPVLGILRPCHDEERRPVVGSDRNIWR